MNLFLGEQNILREFRATELAFFSSKKMKKERKFCNTATKIHAFARPFLSGKLKKKREFCDTAMKIRAFALWPSICRFPMSASGQFLCGGYRFAAGARHDLGLGSAAAVGRSVGHDRSAPTRRDRAAEKLTGENLSSNICSASVTWAGSRPGKRRSQLATTIASQRQLPVSDDSTVTAPLTPVT